MSAQTIYYRGQPQAGIDQRIKDYVTAENPWGSPLESPDDYMRQAIAAIPAGTSNTAALALLQEQLQRAEENNWTTVQATGIESAMTYFYIREQIRANPTSDRLILNDYGQARDAAKEAARGARSETLSTSNPEQAIIEEEISSPGMRRQVSEYIAQQRREHRGITNAEIGVNITNRLSATEPGWGNLIVGQSLSTRMERMILTEAKKVVDRLPPEGTNAQGQTATAGNTPGLSGLPSRGDGDAQLTGSLDITPGTTNRSEYSIAWGEFMANGGNNVPQAVRTRADQLVRSQLGAITATSDDQFNAAFRAFDAASAGDTDEAKANQWARSLLYRARHIHNERVACRTRIPGFANGDEMNNYYFGADATNPIAIKRAQVANVTPATLADGRPNASTLVNLATANFAKVAMSEMVPNARDRAAVTALINRTRTAAGASASDLDVLIKLREHWQDSTGDRAVTQRAINVLYRTMELNNLKSQNPNGGYVPHATPDDAYNTRAGNYAMAVNGTRAGWNNPAQAMALLPGKDVTVTPESGVNTAPATTTTPGAPGSTPTAPLDPSQCRGRAAGDNECYGPYTVNGVPTTYTASAEPRGKVREAQFLLEQLGTGYTTGGRNTSLYNAGGSTQAQMDGIVGPLTDAAIKRFQTEHQINPVNGQLDEATLTALRAEVANRQTSAPGATTSTALPTEESITTATNLVTTSYASNGGIDAQEATSIETALRPIIAGITGRDASQIQALTTALGALRTSLENSGVTPQTDGMGEELQALRNILSPATSTVSTPGT